MLLFSRFRPHWGEITAEITGLQAQRVLALAQEAGIPLYHVRRLAYTRICASMNAYEYFKFRRIIPKDSYRIRVISCRGLFCLLFALRKRYCLIGGLVLCSLLLALASTRVWSVKVAGCAPERAEEILHELREYGLTPGCAPDAAFLDECETRLLRRDPTLLWATLYRRGSELQVRVKEKDESYLAESTAAPADVVADRVGLVEEVLVMQGVPAVTKGQLVRVGQTLISGRLEYAGTFWRYVHAQGVIRARVWHSAEKTVPLYTFDVRRTGRTATVRTLQLPGISVPIGENPFSAWESERHSKTVMQLGVPLTVTETVYYETVSVRRELPEAEAVARAAEELLPALSPLPERAQILSRSVQHTRLEGRDSVTVTLYLETLEEIGITQAVSEP